MNPTVKSWEVVGTFDMYVCPVLSSKHTASVKVPPMSTPTLTIPFDTSDKSHFVLFFRSASVAS